MSQKFPYFYTSVGIHPENAKTFSEQDVAELEKYLKENKVVAIGEIGLDYHYEGFDRARQMALFRAQVELANAHGLPVIVHSRDATEDCLQVLRELRPQGILHCFSGSWETAQEVLKLGMYLGFTGALTFRNARRAVEVVREMPADRLVLETDCPYMAPEPLRGRRCDSSMIVHTARRAAEIRGVEYNELVAAAEENACRVYGIV